MRGNVTRWRPLPVTSLVAVLAVVAAGVSHGASDAVVASRAPAEPTAKAPKPATAKQWAQIVARAKREGSVTLYSTQNPATLADMAKKFEERYGIKVTINRQIDSVLQTQVTAEHAANKVIADIWVSASKPLVLGAHQPQNRWVADAVGPELFAKAYDRQTFAGPAKAFVVGLSVLGMGWNTTQVPQGLNELTDVLNPRLKGRIGVPAPAAPSFVDWYLWLQETYGRTFLPRLAAQEPKIYPSSLPMTQAVASGEIAAGTFVVANILDLKGQGAPVGFKLWKGFRSWNAPFWAMVLKKAPHPNAAQVLASYMVTREGQGTSMRLSGSVLKGVPNTFFVTPRKQNLKNLTPQKVAAFQQYWDSLFRK